MKRTSSWYLRGLLTLIVLIISIGLGKQASASIEIYDQNILGNPNNTISALYSIHGYGISSAYIETMCLDCDEREKSVPDWERTPTFTIESGRFVLPVLGLRPDSSYLMRAVLIDSFGGQVVTDSLPFQTGSIPDELDYAFNPTGSDPFGGYLFISYNSTMSKHRGYVWALDQQGRIAWYMRIRDSRVQSLIGPSEAGTLLLSYWGFDYSRLIYEVDLFGNVVGGHELPLHPSEDNVFQDGHDFILTSNGEKIFLCITTHILDMTPYGGLPDTPLTSSLIRRVLPDGTIDFDWDYIDHFPLTDSYEALDNEKVDWVHANSMDIDVDGNYLVSSRLFCEVTKINSTDGSVMWRLGGKKSDFTFVGDDLGGFSHQHSARILGDNHILLFDNGNFHTPRESRAVEYELDLDNMTATLVWQYRHDPILFCTAIGSVQRLTNGNTLINYGATLSNRNRVLEVTPAGEIAWELLVPFNFSGTGFYRAFRFESLYLGVEQVGDYQDLDEDNWFGFFDCDDQDPQIQPGGDDPCDGIDQDCNGVDGTDEIPDNGVDDDCDGRIDEQCFIGMILFFP